jgi:hypothetical protein
VGIINEAELEALMRKVAHEEARPILVNQRTVLAVVGLPAGAFLTAARAGAFQSSKLRRLVFAKTADVVAYVEAHPVTPRIKQVAVASGDDEEARLLARVGARRVAR